MTQAPKLRNRTILALADVLAGCFDFMVNIGGKFESRTRPDLLADLLFAEEFHPKFVLAARAVQSQPGSIKRERPAVC